jgi:hypothetical protein
VAQTLYRPDNVTFISGTISCAVDLQVNNFYGNLTKESAANVCTSTSFHPFRLHVPFVVHNNKTKMDFLTAKRTEHNGSVLFLSDCLLYVACSCSSGNKPGPCDVFKRRLRKSKALCLEVTGAIETFSREFNYKKHKAMKG